MSWIPYHIDFITKRYGSYDKMQMCLRIIPVKLNEFTSFYLESHS
jgi:hypothetical protein